MYMEKLNINISVCEDLDQYALLARQDYNLGKKNDWFGYFRGGLYGFYARIYGVRLHYKDIYSWKFEVHHPVEYNLSSILFNMDSAIECFVFCLNALGYAALPSSFRNVGDDSQFLSELAIYHGICAGLAVLTEGILVAPLEGVVSCRILSNEDASECLAVNYAGPIRSAGGTGQALSVLIADILRRDFGYATPQVTFSEVERYKEEVSKYSRGLQYRPSNPQLEVIAKNCPVYVDGEGVGDEVTGQRDLPRVPTNKVREGMLLVMCEGLILKAPKILKYVEALELDGWDWLKSCVQTKSGATEIKPSEKYMSDVLAGRPSFGLPMQVGGLRLRYGRTRLAGLAATAMHPVTMMAMAGFVICGTQMKYERPGKATVATPCDSIDGPYVELNDGSAKRFSD